MYVMCIFELWKVVVQMSCDGTYHAKTMCLQKVPHSLEACHAEMVAWKILSIIKLFEAIIGLLDWTSSLPKDYDVNQHTIMGIFLCSMNAEWHNQKQKKTKEELLTGITITGFFCKNWKYYWKILLTIKGITRCIVLLKSKRA